MSFPSSKPFPYCSNLLMLTNDLISQTNKATERICINQKIIKWAWKSECFRWSHVSLRQPVFAMGDDVWSEIGEIWSEKINWNVFMSLSDDEAHKKCFVKKTGAQHLRLLSALLRDWRVFIFIFKLSFKQT